MNKYTLGMFGAVGGAVAGAALGALLALLFTFLASVRTQGKKEYVNYIPSAVAGNIAAYAPKIPPRQVQKTDILASVISGTYLLAIIGAMAGLFASQVWYYRKIQQKGQQKEQTSKEAPVM